MAPNIMVEIAIGKHKIIMVSIAMNIYVQLALWLDKYAIF